MKHFATLTPLIFGLFWTGTLMATEEPKFESLRKEENIEIRRYVPVIVAETTVDGDMDSASNQGFQRIAGYIFGQNERIVMTAPVVAEAQSNAEKIGLFTGFLRQKSGPDMMSSAFWYRGTTECLRC